MSLKFQREDSLDKMFDDFAFLPDNDKDNKKQELDIERFLKDEPKLSSELNDTDKEKLNKTKKATDK